MRTAIFGCGSTNCACVYNAEMASAALDARDAEITRLRARVEDLEGLARESLNALTFDRNGPHRNALRAALEAKP